MTKKVDINLSKFKNIESSKMVLTAIIEGVMSNLIKSDFKCDFDAKSERKYWNYMVFLSTQKSKMLIKNVILAPER